MPSTIKDTSKAAVRFPVWVDVDPADTKDLGALSWTLTFNESDEEITGTPQAATVVSGTSSQTTLQNGQVRCFVKIRILIGPGGGYQLAKGDWYVFAHTTSGDEAPEFYVGILTVN